MVGDFKASLLDLDLANTLNQHDDFTLSQRGFTRRLLGDLEGSLNDLNMAEALATNVDRVFTWRERGVTKRLLGDLRGSLEGLKKKKKNNKTKLINSFCFRFKFC